jgi:hypothetical protein
MQSKVYADKKFGFPCGFLGAVVTFGVAFFPNVLPLELRAEISIFSMKRNRKTDF